MPTEMSRSFTAPTIPSPAAERQPTDARSREPATGSVPSTPSAVRSDSTTSSSRQSIPEERLATTSTTSIRIPLSWSTMPSSSPLSPIQSPVIICSSSEADTSPPTMTALPSTWCSTAPSRSRIHGPSRKPRWVCKNSANNLMQPIRATDC